MAMKITLLGTGNPAPSLKRMGSGYIVEIADDVIVFDHGPGSHHRLLQTGKRASDVTHTFFSHLHYDHFVDFPRQVRLAFYPALPACLLPLERLDFSLDFGLVSVSLA